MKKPLFPRLLLASSIALALAACGGGGGGGDDDLIDDDNNTPPPSGEQPPATQPPATQPPATQPPAATPTAGDTYAVTASNKLITFNRAEPGTVRTTTAIANLNAGENILDIDFRPADNALYALTSTGRVVTIDLASGAATLKSTLAPFTGDAFTALSGTDFGIDFDPNADRLRVISDNGQVLRVNVDTGATITGRSVVGSSITDVAYTNSFAGADAFGSVFGLDATADSVGVIRFGSPTATPPTDTTLNTPKAVGADFSVINGFDIDGRNNIGYAALSVGGAPTLYTINPNVVSSTTSTAAPAAAVGTIGGGEEIRGIAIPTPTVTVQGLTIDNRLVTFSPLTPNTLTSTVAITGLDAGENVLGMDVRPADGLLYAVTNAGRILTIDAAGVATLKSTLAVDPADTAGAAPFTTLGSGEYAVDFNPAVDRLRLVGSNGENLRINVDTGATITDTNVTTGAGTPNIVAGAYSNNFAGAANANLRVIDRATNQLYLQDPPNAGTLTATTATLGQTLAGDAGYDVAGGANGLSIASLTTAAGTSLYRIGIGSGAATPINGTTDPALSVIGAGDVSLRDIAITLK